MKLNDIIYGLLINIFKDKQFFQLLSIIVHDKLDHTSAPVK